MPEPAILVLDDQTIAGCLATLDPLAIVSEVLTSRVPPETSVLPAEAYLAWQSPLTGAGCRSVAMPGGATGSSGPFYGIKVINAAEDNPGRGMARANGISLLFDPVTARPVVLADAARISALRTAAVSVLAIQKLGPEQPRQLAVIGCGTQARVHLELALAQIAGLRRIRLFDTDSQRAARLGEYVSQLGSIEVSVSRDLPDALSGSDVVLTLTTSQRPYIGLRLLEQRCLVVHVSLDDIEAEVFRAATAVYVDDLGLVMDNPRRILGRLLQEQEKPSITGLLGEVLVGRVAAVRPSDGIVVVNPFGMAVLDIAILGAVAEIARAQGQGHTLHLS